MKNNYFILSESQKQLVLEQTSIKHNLSKQAVEKDLWVTAIIQRTARSYMKSLCERALKNIYDFGQRFG